MLLCCFWYALHKASLHRANRAEANNTSDANVIIVDPAQQGQDVSVRGRSVPETRTVPPSALAFVQFAQVVEMTDIGSSDDEGVVAAVRPAPTGDGSDDLPVAEMLAPTLAKFDAAQAVRAQEL